MQVIRNIWISRLAAPLVIALSACAVLAGNAGAGKSHSPLVSGTYTVTDLGATDCVPIDVSRLRCTTTGLASAYSGDLEGTTRSDFEQIVNCATRRAHGHGLETFTGSLRGGPAGTLAWRVFFTADVDCATLFPSNLRILGVVTRGSGGLASLNGALLFDDTTYRGALA